MTATREQDSQLPAATRRAYRKARYRVFTEPPLTLRVGEPNARLARVHRQYGVTCSAFVTACNPRGEMGTDGENHARQQALAVNLDQKGHARLTGIGEDPAGEWPGEASLLILGMNREETADLGAQWGQNAVVWAGADATPELIFLR